MFLRRRHREVPGLNTTSTADISFMLLVFFLVTSSMDSDKGLGRKLPPVDEQQQEQGGQRDLDAAPSPLEPIFALHSCFSVGWLRRHERTLSMETLLALAQTHPRFSL